MKTLLICLIFLTTSIVFVRAEASYGLCDYGKETLTSVECAGMATLVGTTVQNKVSVLGPLKTVNAHLNTLEVVGVARLENTTVSGVSDVIGYLTADHCSFSESLSVKSDEVNLIATTITGPNAELKIESTFKTPVVYLKSGSQVDTIIFENHTGIVKVDDHSKINEVTNGQVVKM